MNALARTVRSPFSWASRQQQRFQLWLTLRWAEDERSHYRQQPGAQLHVVRQMDRDIDAIRTRRAALLNPR